MKTSIICVPGTGESYPGDTRRDVTGMLANVTRLLDPERFAFRWVGYPAEYGRGMSYAESVAAGEQALIEAIDLDPYPAIVLGYSQGSAIVGNVAARLDSLPHLDVRAVAMFSDPLRDRRQYAPMPIAPEGYGACGERWIDDTRRHVWSFSAQGDPISSLPAGSPLRSLADWSDWMSTSDPQAWARDIITDIRTRRMQRWWDIKNWRDWADALAFAKGLIQDGRHFAYGTGELVPGTSSTYAQLLAEQIIALADTEQQAAA